MHRRDLITPASGREGLPLEKKPNSSALSSQDGTFSRKIIIIIIVIMIVIIVIIIVIIVIVIIVIVIIVIGKSPGLGV